MPRPLLALATAWVPAASCEVGREAGVAVLLGLRAALLAPRARGARGRRAAVGALGAAAAPSAARPRLRAPGLRVGAALRASSRPARSATAARARRGAGARRRPGRARPVAAAGWRSSDVTTGGRAASPAGARSHRRVRRAAPARSSTVTACAPGPTLRPHRRLPQSRRQRRPKRGLARRRRRAGSGKSARLLCTVAVHRGSGRGARAAARRERALRRFVPAGQEEALVRAMVLGDRTGIDDQTGGGLPGLGHLPRARALRRPGGARRRD